MVEVARSVAVIGAGASGLVACRHLIRCGFRPLLLEATSHHAGAWHTSSDQFWQSLQPNLSRYTQCFSDFPWSRVFTHSDAKSLSHPAFPSRAQVQTYLDLYATEHDLHPRFGCTVTRVSRRSDNEPLTSSVGTSSSSFSPQSSSSIHSAVCCDMHGYTVTWTEDNHQTFQTQQFDQVVIATGFFADPVLPPCFQNPQPQPHSSSESEGSHDILTNEPPKPASTELPLSSSSSLPRIIHSSQYTSSAAFANQTVAVVGSAFSALEIASDLCASSNSSDTAESSASTTKVVSVLPSIPWVLPRRIPTLIKRTNAPCQVQPDENELSSSSKLPISSSSLSSSSSFSSILSIVPLDLVLYRRTSVAPQALKPIMTAAIALARNEALQALVGTRKQAAAIGLPPHNPMRRNGRSRDAKKNVNGSRRNQNADGDGMDHVDDNHALILPTAVISDDYLDLVLSDRIHVVHGRVVDYTIINGDDDKPTIQLTILGENDGNEESKSDGPLQQTINRVDSVICCTGYRSNLQFLDSDILNILQYDAQDTFIPLDLAWNTLHPQLPGLAFVGMYRGVYFGVAELQARLISELWSHPLSLLPITWQALHAQTSIDRSVVRNHDLLKKMEEALTDARTVRAHRPRAQFPQFDIIGHMDALASLLSQELSQIVLPSFPYNQPGCIVTPSFYQPSLDCSHHAQKEMDKEIQRGELLHSFQPEGGGGGDDTLDLSQVVLSALIGRWTFERTITHYSESGFELRQERVTGTVRYTVRQDSVVRYREDGVFLLPNGKAIDVFREYEYIATPQSVEIYFVENHARAHLFLQLQFQPTRLCSSSNVSDNNHCATTDSGPSWCWKATSDHLCGQDMYMGSFQIDWGGGISASRIVQTYRVNGPNKDYESVTILTPL